MKKLITILLTLAMVFTLSSSVMAKELIQIKGSDTLINLVQKLAEDYMAKYKDTDIAVTGGGSGTGIAALLNQKTDIADASRSIKGKEVKKAESKGIKVISAVIAMDGLSVITNESNPVKNLTVDQVGKMYRGEITNWKDIGGPDLKVTLYGRQSNSGTFVFFRKAVVKADYSQKMLRMNGNSQIVEGVRSDKGGIGYVGVGYVKDKKTGGVVKGINVIMIAKDAHSAPGSPLDTQAVVTGTYPLVRPLFQYMDSNIKPSAKKFVEWELSKTGQDIAVEMGFYPVTEKYKKSNMKNGF
jgi:phosphate transport system substrate-binding protein